jgi:hypothetical protein
MAKSKKRSKKKSGDKYETGDKISVSNVSDHAAVAAGRGALASVQHTESPNTEIVEWVIFMEKKIDSNEKLSPQDKEDLKEQVGKISDEVNKGKDADKNRLERLINVLSVMAPDIFEVAIASIASPLAGLGLALKKIGDKAKLMNANEV